MNKLIKKKVIALVWFSVLLMISYLGIKRTFGDIDLAYYSVIGFSFLFVLNSVSIIRFYFYEKKLDELYVKQKIGKEMPIKVQILNYTKKYDLNLEVVILIICGALFCLFSAKTLINMKFFDYNDSLFNLFFTKNNRTGLFALFWIFFSVFGIICAFVTLDSNIFNFLEYESESFVVTEEKILNFLLDEETIRKAKLKNQGEFPFGEFELAYLKFKNEDMNLQEKEEVFKNYENQITEMIKEFAYSKANLNSLKTARAEMD